MPDEPKRPDAKSSAPGSESPSTGGKDSDDAKRSGRVTFDSRGNSVWEWQLETGVYSRDVNTQKLKKLDLGELSIAETAIQKKPPGLDKDEPRAGGGFNPYDNAPSRSKPDGYNPYDRALAKRSAEQVPPEKSEPPKARTRNLDELRKLSEAIKLKKRTSDDQK